MTFDRLWQIVRLRVRSLFSGSAVDRELDEELRDHVERQIESNLQAGMTPIEARRSALVAIGGVRQTAEQCRDQRGLRGVDATVADTRYALRVLKRSPVFALVAIASLALGIGAFLAMFQLVDAIRLRPLPVDDAHELVEIRIAGGRGGWGLSDTAAEITLPLWEQIRAHQTVLTDLFAWGRSGFLYRGFRFTAVDASHGVSRLRAAYESPLWLLLGTTGLILLLTLSNLATLMLARAHARRRELAMLLALGASRGRLISQTVIEAVLLSAAGVALALPLAIGGGRLLVVTLSTAFDPLHVALGVDWRAAGVAAIVVVVTALAFGLLPAFQSSRFDPLPVLRSGGRSHTVDRRRAALQRLLVVGQLAICFVLVVSAMLFARSLYNITATDVGFNPTGLQVVGFGDPIMDRLSLAERHAFQQVLLETVESIPGVQSAGAVSQVPLSGASWNQAFNLRGDPARLSVKFTYVSPGYFTTLQVPIRAGRGFDTNDRAQSKPVAIVNDAFARRFLGGTVDADVIQTLTEANYPPTAYEVVGRVGNTKYGDVREDDLPIVYVPLAQAPVISSWKSVIVRTSMTPGAFGEAVRRRVRALNPGIWVRMTDLPAQLNQRLARERMMAWLAGAFGVLAVLLAAVGLYGLIAYLAVGRRSEIGVRLALGATRVGVVLMMLRESAWLVGAGLTAGLALSVVLSRGASRLLFQLAPTDAATWAGAALALASVAAIAAIVPAWRTAGIDPVTTLRAEE